MHAKALAACSLKLSEIKMVTSGKIGHFKPICFCCRVHKVVVFILEDFEKFTGRRQAVFYNILDTMHGPDIQAGSCPSLAAHKYYLMQCCICEHAL